jgi:hypothetical protein
MVGGQMKPRQFLSRGARYSAAFTVMKHYGLTINLKDDPKVIETYKEYHCHLWPAVEVGLHRAGIARTRIFLL